ncbi:MAG TPA: DUF5808 domain-containing protein [Saprospiraceae bacterium]|nr:DUF5808 domain-containing protein [Saprospiraceae bacterium]
METKEKPGKEILQQWHDDPSNWRWGIFYYNKKDKRIFPPKRIQSLGWTVNFANPYSYLGFLVLFILILLIIKYVL